MSQNILLLSNNLEKSIDDIFEFFDIVHSSKSPTGIYKTIFLGFKENEDPLLVNKVLNIIDNNNEKYCLYIDENLIKTNLSLSDENIFLFFINAHKEEERTKLKNLIKYS
tara:strand:- start:41461 stop:41790 length:330 start_codon:yes stop_codon:yes gene_type:complete